MSVDYKYIKKPYKDDIFGIVNNPALPGGVLDKVRDEFERVNGPAVMPGDEAFIPVLPPFHKRHAGLLDISEIEIYQAPVEPEPEPEEIEQITREQMAEQRPKFQTGSIHYRKYPYTFSRPGETIEAIIRLYNDMSISRQVIDKLVYEFSAINKDALPPRLGQTVDVPVLLPFCFRHENENKIFTDE